MFYTYDLRHMTLLYTTTILIREDIWHVSDITLFYQIRRYGRLIGALYIL